MPDTDLQLDLTRLLNRHSVENQSNTPDFALATFLRGCIAAWNAGIAERDRFWSFDPWKDVWERGGLDAENAPPSTYEERRS